MDRQIDIISFGGQIKGQTNRQYLKVDGQINSLIDRVDNY